MKYAVSVVVFIVGLAWAEEVEPARLLNELTAANKARDSAKIGSLLKGIAEVGKVSKDQKTVDALAKELANSFKVCKGNWGTLRAIADTLGELRSKSTVETPKRYAYQTKAKDDNEDSIQIRALLAIGKMADPEQIEPLGDQCRNRDLPVAKAAYEAFKHYGTAKGKTRKRCAELLMKRLEAEYPSSGGQQGGGTVSHEAQERWRQLSTIIVASMQAVCHEPSINDVDNWREWWKENRRRSGAWKDKGLQRDDYNLQVLAQASKLVNQGRYEEAEKYLQQHGNPDGSGYIEIEKRIQQIQAIKENYDRNVKEQRALKVTSKLARRIMAYHAGKDVQPEQILALVEQLKTDFAGTEQAARARKEWRSWFAGRVPRRAVDLLTSGGRKRKDWEEAVERAAAFRKEWRFREARETIDRYITVRKSILDDEDLAYYKKLRDQQLEIIDRLAASVYEGRASAARRLVKNKRFDAAIQVYQEIVDKFGIDDYVRKAQAEIEKIKAQK